MPQARCGAVSVVRSVGCGGEATDPLDFDSLKPAALAGTTTDLDTLGHMRQQGAWGRRILLVAKFDMQDAGFFVENSEILPGARASNCALTVVGPVPIADHETARLDNLTADKNGVCGGAFSRRCGEGNKTEQPEAETPLP